MPGSPAAIEQAVTARTRAQRPGFVFYVILVSVIALFSAEVWSMTLGFLWALSGIRSLGAVGTAIFAALLLPAATFATWKLAAMAVEGERDLLRQTGPES